MAKQRQPSPPEPKHDPPVWSRKLWTGSATVEVAVFEKMVKNDNGEFLAYNVSAKRTYKAEDAYKSSQGFRADDLPFLIQLLTQAYSYISEQLNRE